MKVLLTCPPMLGAAEHYRKVFDQVGVELVTPAVKQALSEAELIAIVPECDGWIIGDDPATATVFRAGSQGRLKAAVKWGVGVDNVDFDGARACGIPVVNTPGMFGREVADLAALYVLGLAREAFSVDREVREGGWPKPCGISLADKVAALVGFGDIGREVAVRLAAFGMSMRIYDPYASEPFPAGSSRYRWPDGLAAADYIIFTCALTADTHHMLDAATLQRARNGVRIVNVARGPLIDEPALIAALASGHVHSAALDVFEREPLPADSPLRDYSRCILGSHNGSHTEEAVRRASDRAVGILLEYLGVE